MTHVISIFVHCLSIFGSGSSGLIGEEGSKKAEKRLHDDDGCACVGSSSPSLASLLKSTATAYCIWRNRGTSL